MVLVTASAIADPWESCKSVRAHISTSQLILKHLTIFYTAASSGAMVIWMPLHLT